MEKSGYRDLIVWQKARLLATELYQRTRCFPSSERFGLVQQICRAAVSVPSNIAEGHGRSSSPDRLHFLLIARGSLFEIETQILIAVDLDYLSQSAGDDIVAQTLEVIRTLNGLIRHYASKPPLRR